MTRLGAGVLAAVLLWVSMPALAKDTPQSVIEDAKALAKQGGLLRAAERFGDAVALAQAAGDLDAEDIAAGALDDFWRQIPSDAPSSAADRPASGAVLAAVMARLDASRCGAMVSAPVLARNILMLAVETGDFSS